MRHPTLVVLAAGRSAAFSDRKQETSVGPDGETLYDYTVYDALACGFGRVVFVVRPDNERDVREAFEDRFGPSVLVSYVRQFRPLGTGHAVASLGGLVPGPFALVNANDRYGKAAVQLIADRLRQWEAGGPGPKTRACMVSFRLGDTLSDSGGVSRAVFRPEAAAIPEDVPASESTEPSPRKPGFLSRSRRPDPEPAPAPAPRIEPAGFDEILDIRRMPSGEIVGRRPDGTETRHDPDDRVSMNLWGFDPGIVEALTNGYNQWTYDLDPGQAEEYRLSSGMDRLLKDGAVDLEMIAAPDDAWMGLFHRADVGPVREAVAAAIERGDYPPSLKKAMRG
jgi:hypothetical protein